MYSTSAPERDSTERPLLDSQAGSQKESEALFPAFLKLAGRKCLVVGAGQVGESKIEGLLATGAEITVVSPRATDAVRAWAEAGKLGWYARGFDPPDLDAVFLAVVATSSPLLNEWIFQEAQRRGVLCNVVDDPAHCDFYYPAVVRRGALQIAISTDGKSPALAQRLRKKLEDEFGPVYASWIEELGNMRRQLFAQAMDPEERRRLLHDLASASNFERFSRKHVDVAECPANRKDPL
ncbi:MAG TPA: bifunctional precorrin-2 dehydrogenase/sirohydrochlorin ferrochelatase [Terriglobia bacterium]|nr:bifunctional precorrin-2 dehydrogenase/sirohydrochlorin ferrochelatase [Terriglobia bacterium]